MKDLRGEIVLHVIPIKDDKPHKESEFCECKPRFEDGVYIHNAWDFRDFKEQLSKESL